ncbi:hypothetical protein HPB47_002411 [Ixodes persulcatus]|uniref:Uncharacterized protein n=1 Tax=Ixodes persulcatus TaxID=34615 RepID=A0AC60PLC1_IXOPE|nr:hypothetical protein HPB47_002411 [Ixodes persulcatus]
MSFNIAYFLLPGKSREVYVAAFTNCKAAFDALRYLALGELRHSPGTTTRTTKPGLTTSRKPGTDETTSRVTLLQVCNGGQARKRQKKWEMKDEAIKKLEESLSDGELSI